MKTSLESNIDEVFERAAGIFFPRSEAEETPGSSIFIRSDKRPKPGCDTISTARNAEAPQREVELGLA